MLHSLNSDFFANFYISGHFVNIEDKAILSFDTENVYYCLPISYFGKIWVYGYGKYKYNAKSKSFSVVNNTWLTPKTDEMFPSKSFYLELDNSKLKDNEFYLRIITKENTHIFATPISDALVSQRDSSFTVDADYKLKFTEERRFSNSKIIISDIDASYKKANVDDKVFNFRRCKGFDPLTIDIKNKRKGNFLVILEESQSVVLQDSIIIEILDEKEIDTINSNKQYKVRVKGDSNITTLDYIDSGKGETGIFFID
jgi:hypothetical protein